jgi:hypothetical protein
LTLNLVDAVEDRDVEYRDGFILEPNRRLRKVIGRENPAATHLIAGFNLESSPDGFPTGTVVWFKGNVTGMKVPHGIELGPASLGTHPRGFWNRLERDLQESMRIDRQKYINRDGKSFCDYHLQVGSESLACVLALTDFHVGTTVMRRAFLLSLQATTNVWIDPTNARTGWPHVKR